MARPASDREVLMSAKEHLAKARTIGDWFPCRHMPRSSTRLSICGMSYARRVLAILCLTALMPLRIISEHRFGKWRLTKKE